MYAYTAITGQVGQYCAAYDIFNDQLVGRSVRIAPILNNPVAIVEHLSEGKLEMLAAIVKVAYQANQDSTRTNLTYVAESYYSLPIYLALQLQAHGDYTASLDWFRSVYDYTAPISRRKIYYGLVDEEDESALYQRSGDWLLDPLNPHEIAATRRNTYTRFTVLSIVRCLIEFGNAQFTLDTPETVERARLLYLAALDLLDAPELQVPSDQCGDVIGQLDIQVGSP